MKERPWYDDAFGALYSVLYAHRDADSARSEVDFVIRELPIHKQDVVLDLGCGTGRHLDALKLGGWSGIGLDRSKDLLAQSKERNTRFLIRGDLRSLPLKDKAVDVVLSFFTSFGYFEDEVEDAQVLSEVARILKPNGRYLLDYLSADDVRLHLKPHTLKTVGDYEMEERRRIEGSRVRKQVTIRRIGGQVLHEYEESVRLIEPEALQVMLRSAGLMIRKVFGSLDGRALGDGSRCVLMAEKSS
ncbi:MAG TPA: class I SAM-dependent methyltransferase [Planctomycetota bacterium]|nr:class I SAM-dependent methyltransferase [Planctomycetota bacterium]